MCAPNLGSFTVPPSTSIETGAFAFDMTDSDDNGLNVPESEILDEILPDNYQQVKFKLSRLDEAQGPPDQRPKNLVGQQLDDFMAKLFEGSPPLPDERRPSMWIEGFMEVTSTGNCSPFTFFTNKEQTITIPFANQQTVDPSQLDVIFFLDIDQAFNNLSPTFVQDLDAEIGMNIFGTDFLDGRDFKDTLGTENAVTLAGKLTNAFEVFIQGPGTFDGTMDFDAVPVS